MPKSTAFWLRARSGLALFLVTHPVLAQPTEAAAPPAATLAPANPTPAASTDSKSATASPAAEAAKTEPTKTEPTKAEPTKTDPTKSAATPAATPAPTPAATPTVIAADAISESAVADSLRSLISGKQFDRTVTRKPDREGVEAFYKARDYKPLWLSNGVLDDRAKAAIAYLGQTAADGLDPTDYPVPDFKSAITADALAEAELKLTASVLTYARQAQIGRIHFSRVSADIEFKLVAPEPANVLAKLADAMDVAATLDGYNPPQPEFKALKEKLAELRAGGIAAAKPEDAKPAPVHVPDGKILHVGMKDPRVIALRKRLDVTGDKDNTLYDQAVSDAVKAFQTQPTSASTAISVPTRCACSTAKRRRRRPPADPIDTVIVNMERWRWLPRDLGNPHVIVNVPDYR